MTVADVYADIDGIARRKRPVKPTIEPPVEPPIEPGKMPSVYDDLDKGAPPPEPAVPAAPSAVAPGPTKVATDRPRPPAESAFSKAWGAVTTFHKATMKQLSPIDVEEEKERAVLEDLSPEEAGRRLGVMPSKVAAFREQGPIGWIENITTTTGMEYGEKAPIVGPFFTLEKILQFREHAETLKPYHEMLKFHRYKLRNIEEGTQRIPEGMTEKQFAEIQRENYNKVLADMQDSDAAKFMTEYLDKRAELLIRGKSFLAKVGSGISELPSYMIEFLLTGGVYTAAKKVVVKAAVKYGMRRLAAHAVGAIVGTGARLLVLGTKAVAAAEEQLLPPIQRGPDGELIVSDSDKSRAREYFKQFGILYFELLGEVGTTGALRAVGAISPKARAALQKWVSGKPMSRAGYHGLIGEVGEERFTQGMRKVATDFGYPIDEENWLPSIEEMLVELAVLAVPGAIQAGARRLGREAPEAPERAEVKEPPPVPPEAEVVQPEPVEREPAPVEKVEAPVPKVKVEVDEQVKELVEEIFGPDVKIKPVKVKFIDGEVDTLSVKLPTGQTVYVAANRAAITFDLKKAAKDHGLSYDKVLEAAREGRVSAGGKLRHLGGGKYFMELAPGADSIAHEHFHFLARAVLSDKELSALIKRYKSEEKAAEAYARQRDVTKRNTLFDKIRAFVDRLIPGGVSQVIQDVSKEGPIAKPKPKGVQKPEPEIPPRPLVNPKASAIKQDKQKLAQQRWDKKYGKPEPEAKPKKKAKKPFVRSTAESAREQARVNEELRERNKKTPDHTASKITEWVNIREIGGETGRVSPDGANILIGKNIKKLLDTTPEFAIDPTFTIDKDGKLLFRDGYKLTFAPDTFGIDTEGMKAGTTIRIPLEEFGIKSERYVKKAEAIAKKGFPQRKPGAVLPRGRVSPAGEVSPTEKELQQLAVRRDKRNEIIRLAEEQGEKITVKFRQGLRSLSDAQLDDAIQHWRGGIPEELADVGAAAIPENIRDVDIDSFRHWPGDMPQVGREFWTAVMDTAKKLGTPYRYKALRDTILGIFRFAKGIELQDITKVLTAVHEVGHNVDWLLNDKSFPSSIKLRFPDAQVGERTLRAELKALSEILRPDLWAEGARESVKRRVRTHVELMADAISHYILDPETAAMLAPNIVISLRAKLAKYPAIQKEIKLLQERRLEGGMESSVAADVRKTMLLPEGGHRVTTRIDLSEFDDAEPAFKELAIQTMRRYKVLMARARRDADKIRQLVPSQERREDLRVLAENGTRNIRTNKPVADIKAELTPDEVRALRLYRGFQEKARQTVNRYMRGANVAEYIKFLENYFIHAYQTPMNEKFKSAISRWAKKSPSAKRRVLPTLEEADDLGMTPRTHDLAEGLEMWAGINYRVAVNRVLLKRLPKILNADGESVVQKPADKPDWPTVDYWPIRKTYALPLKGRGILLFQGRIALDPAVKPMIDALFARAPMSKPARVVQVLNAVAKAFELTIGSFFHHQAETFSAIGTLGPRRVLTGLWGKEAAMFGGKRFLGLGPRHISLLKAGKVLEAIPEFMDDFLAHGGQTGYITTEGINTLERMMVATEKQLETISRKKGTLTRLGATTGRAGVAGVRAPYQWAQHLLWDNVLRARLVGYNMLVVDGLNKTDLPAKRVKELVVKYLADNFGGQEWLDSTFKNPRTRWYFSNLMLSLDWTWSQLKTPLWLAGKGVGARTAAERKFARRLGRKHWARYLTTIAGITVAMNYLGSGKPPWDNEKDRKWDIDWTNMWRGMDAIWSEIMGTPNWKERGDNTRRYISLGKAGREILRWFDEPIKEFGNKLSPVASTVMEQLTGSDVGGSWEEPWAREDLDRWDETYERFKHVMGKFKPFSLSGNNAFLAFPSRKGMTKWKAHKAYFEVYKARAEVAAGGITGVLTRISRVLEANEDKLLQQITEAAEANGLDAERSRKAAMAKARSTFYRRFWAAAKNRDVKNTNKWASALLSLGVMGGSRGYRQSEKYRGAELSFEAKKLAEEAMIKEK